MHNDYSTSLMNVERSVKTLGEMCLNKQYTGFYSEINTIISNLIGLSHWIGQEQVKQSQSNRSYSK
jgi:hypothetical protein